MDKNIALAFCAHPETDGKRLPSSLSIAALPFAISCLSMPPINTISGH